MENVTDKDDPRDGVQQLVRLYVLRTSTIPMYRADVPQLPETDIRPVTERSPLRTLLRVTCKDAVTEAVYLR